MSNNASKKSIYVLFGVVIILLMINIFLIIENKKADTLRVQEQVLASDTPTIIAFETRSPSRTPISTSTPKPTSNVPEVLDVCEEPSTKNCFYLPNVEGNKVVILLWVEEMNEKEPPYILVGTTRYECSIPDFKNEILYCSGPKTSSQEITIQLFSNDGKLISIGKVSWDNTQPPSVASTKTPKSNEREDTITNTDYPPP